MQTRERKNLSAAIAAHRAAQKDVEHAEGLLQRAHDMAESLELKCEEFEGLDNEIAAANAANVAHAIESGESLLTERPQGFASKIIARDHTLAELESVNQALPVLQEQLESAKRHAQDASQAVEEATEAVFIREAEELAASYMAKLREVREMANMLHFMTMRQVSRHPNERKSVAPGLYYGNEPSRKIRMPDSVVAACRENPMGDFDLRGGIQMRDNVSAAIAAYWQKLHDDPNAKLEIGEMPPKWDADAFLAKLKVKS